jgi:hypothetical protein
MKTYITLTFTIEPVELPAATYRGVPGGPSTQAMRTETQMSPDVLVT